MDPQTIIAATHAAAGALDLNEKLDFLYMVAVLGMAMLAIGGIAFRGLNPNDRVGPQRGRLVIFYGATLGAGVAVFIGAIAAISHMRAGDDLKNLATTTCPQLLDAIVQQPSEDALRLYRQDLSCSTDALLATLLKTTPTNRAALETLLAANAPKR